MRAIARAWQNDCSSPQRSGWSTYAQSLDYTDSLGVRYHPNGFDAFAAVNMLRRGANQNIGLDPPGLGGFASFTKPRCDWTVDSGPDGRLKVYFSPADPWCRENGGALLLRMSARRATGAIRKYWGPWHDVWAINGSVEPEHPPAVYHFPRGWILAGKLYAAEIRSIRASGRYSKPLLVQGIATGPPN